jgi:arylsulfatase A-like enzyme
VRRREFLRLAAAAAAAPPLNVVFILADDLGWADLGCYGADLHETPNLDRLAQGSVRFTDACAAAPVCSPTRAAILTGKWPARLKMTIWREASLAPPAGKPLKTPVTQADLPLSEVTLGKVLRGQGYATAHVGKWHLGAAGHYPEAHGFDINIGGTLWGAPQTYFYPYTGSKRYGGEFRYVPGLGEGRPGEYLTDRLTDEAIRIVRNWRERRFFLNLWYHTPHTPIEGKPAYVDYFERKKRASYQHQNAGYAAMVRSLDENVGRVLRTLEETGLAEQTVVIFTSDNGGSVGRFDGQVTTSNHPLRSGKGSLYEGGVRVPLLVRAPGIAPGVCREPVISNDLFATVAEFGGARVDRQDGYSLKPLLENPAGQLPREELYFHYPHYYETTTPVSAIRTRKWKLLEYFEDNRLELYDLERDGGEQADVARQEPRQAEALHRRLKAWRDTVGAQLPERWN